MTAAILQPYSRPGFWQRHRRLAFFLLGFFAFFYGAFFAITTIYLLEQMAIPLAMLALLVIWLLPETGKAPLRLVEGLFFAFLVALFFWPDYLALALPGLPWITALRLVGFPLFVVFLISLSQSASFRRQLSDILGAAPIVWKLVAAFTVLAMLSIFYSTNVGLSMSKFVVIVMNWTLLFFIACFVLAKPGRMDRFCYLMWFAVLFICAIGFFELRDKGVPWAGHVPSLLKVDNPLVEKIMAGSQRTFADSDYRLQTKFVTPLEMAEFVASSLPFVIFIMMNARKFAVRVMAGATLPVMVFMIFYTDARLGNVGMISSFALCTLIYGARTWRNNRSSIIGSATVMSFPLGAIAIFIGSFFIGRLRKMVWGRGVQQYSTEARQEQFALGFPKVLDRPWGFGFGNPELGYFTPDGFETIDSYYLSVLLETGPVGFLLFFGIFATAIFKAVKVFATSKVLTHDHMLLATCAICLINFVIIKSVLSQISNHPLFFVVLGGVVALLYRIQQAEKEERARAVPGPQLPR